MSASRTTGDSRLKLRLLWSSKQVVIHQPI